jgi:hypothetical protein
MHAWPNQKALANVSKIPKTSTLGLYNWVNYLGRPYYGPFLMLSKSCERIPLKPVSLNNHLGESSVSITLDADTCMYIFSTEHLNM